MILKGAQGFGAHATKHAQPTATSEPASSEIRDDTVEPCPYCGRTFGSKHGRGTHVAACVRGSVARPKSNWQQHFVPVSVDGQPFWKCKSCGTEVRPKGQSRHLVGCAKSSAVSDSQLHPTTGHTTGTPQTTQVAQGVANAPPSRTPETTQVALGVAPSRTPGTTQVALGVAVAPPSRTPETTQVALGVANVPPSRTPRTTQVAQGAANVQCEHQPHSPQAVRPDRGASDEVLSQGVRVSGRDDGDFDLSFADAAEPASVQHTSSSPDAFSRSTHRASSHSESDPEYNHSVDSEPRVHSAQRPVDQSLYETVACNPRLRLPPAASVTVWKRVDNELGAILRARLPQFAASVGAHDTDSGGTIGAPSTNIDAEVDLFDTILYEYLATEFGCVSPRASNSAERGRPATTKMSRSDRRVEQEMRNLKREANEMWKERRDLAQPADASTFSRVMRLTDKLRHVVDKQQARTDAADEQRRFNRDRHRYAENLFSPRSNKKPTFTKEACEQHFRATYSDDTREQPYDSPPPGVQRPAPPEVAFDSDPPTDDEIRSALWKKRNRSSPGPNGIPYVVFKRCAYVRRVLTAIIQHVWVTRRIPRAWQTSSIILIAKSDKLDSPKEFRPIALLNTGGKVFMSEVNRRMERFMLANQFIDLRVQKAFLSGVPGCVEHTAKLHEALHHAKDNRRPICVSFLDLENAYGSIKHNMFQFALHWYHVPASIRDLLFDYYERQVAHVRTDEWTTDWFQMATGALQGCTASTGLFGVAFNVLLDGLKRPELVRVGYRISDDSDPLLRTAFADDIGLMTDLPENNQIVIDRVQELLEWTGSMRLKPVKCRSLAMRVFTPGRPSKYTPAHPLQYSAYDPLLSANGVPMKFIGDDPEPFKFLGMLVAADLSDTVARQRIRVKLDQLLELIDQQPLRGRMKLWLYNSYVAAKLSWMLMIYDLPLTMVESLESTCTRYLKKWLGIPRSANVDVLYVFRKLRGLQLQNVATAYKRLQLVRLHLLKHSADDQVRLMYERMRDGPRDKRRKFDPIDQLELLEAMVNNEHQLNVQARNRVGIGYDAPDRTAKFTPAQVRRQVVELQANASNDERLAHLRTLEMQGKWARWDSVMSQDFQWQRMFTSMTDEVLKFVINAQLLTLPSEDNKRRWKIQSSQTRCELLTINRDGSHGPQCGQEFPTAPHVLTGCKAALNQGRYTWRHNSVLLVLKQHLVPHIRAVNERRVKLTTQRKLVWKCEDGSWYRPGSSEPVHAPQRLYEYLARATDWEITFDLPGNDAFTHRVFPADVVSTKDRPDVLLLSRANKWALVIELTCPKEERIHKAHSGKTSKYAHLVEGGELNGWSVGVWAVEVGCRGYVAISTIKVLRAFRFTRSQQCTIKHELEDVVRRCSYYIWCSRHLPTWNRTTLLVPSSGPFKSTKGSDA